VDLCSLEDAAVRTAAFQYLCDNLSSKYPNYKPSNFGHVAFIPAENNDSNHLGKLGDVTSIHFFCPVVIAQDSFQVFSGTQWKALGFSVVQDKYREAPISELGIQQHPPIPMLLAHLEKTPPPNEDTARQWFEILFERISCEVSPRRLLVSLMPL